ncbi:MAG: glycosyltransferase family 2 protein [Pseudomonadota bacterium]
MTLTDDATERLISTAAPELPDLARTLEQPSGAGQPDGHVTSAERRTKVAVVIPFYQHEAGILTKAVQSVFAQGIAGSADLWVVIVDDASPVPASAEVAGLRDGDRSRITVLEQPNAGPGQARNAALDLIAGQGADFVAFLDSDDVWKPDHLRDALSALDRGHDFYFCDHVRFEDTTTYASTIPALARLADPATAGYAVIDPVGPVITVDRDAVLAAYLKQYLSQTSTVVMRQSCMQTLRFDPELRGAGEDHLFWIMAVADGARMAISWRVNVYCGRGVNVYYSAFDFASVKAVDRIGYLSLFWYKCGILPASKQTRVAARHMQRRYLRAYSYMYLRAIFRGQNPEFGLFRKIWKRFPLMPFAMPFRFLAVLPRRREESELW